MLRYISFLSFICLEQDGFLELFLSVLIYTDLIETKNFGIMDMLNEEGKLPKSSEEHFTTEVHQKHGKHFRLAVRESFLKDVS